MNRCPMCDRTIADTAYVCTVCAGRVARRLREAGDLWTEVAVVIARQTRYGDRVRLSGAEPPIPFNPAASERAAAVVNTFTTWARHIQEQSGRMPSRGPELPGWLAGQCDWLRYRPEAAEALDDLEDAAAMVYRMVDAPAPRAYLGPCGEDGCTGELYAVPGRIVRCRDCGTVHDPDARRAWLASEAAEVVGSAADMARYASALLGDLVSAEVIRGLAHRGRISAVRDDGGRPRYRVGDVMAVMTARSAAS